MECYSLTEYRAILRLTSAYRFHFATGGKRHGVGRLESCNFVAAPQEKETREENEQDTSLSRAYGTSAASQDCVFRL